MKQYMLYGQFYVRSKSISMEKVRETLKLPCQNICISLPFAAVDVSRGGTSATQRQKFHTDDVKICPETDQKR